MKAVHLKIYGKVQGVFFRAEAKRKADELGLTGWVKNCDDGSVEVFAQGEESALQILEAWCWKGPAAAEIRNVETRKVSLEEWERFDIRY